jgi:3-isopropylmalate/(R)-2-methylmalate dehydratase small subunit
MSFQKFTSSVLRIPVKDIDTDMIIPAEFLTTTKKEGLGEFVFQRLRKSDPNFPMNIPELRDAKIIIAGKNFGCGSSREHAPWALYDWGIRVVISSEFADIFRGNAEKNGLLLIMLPEEVVNALLEGDQKEKITVDLLEECITRENGMKYHFQIPSFTKKRFLEGFSDIEYLLKFTEEIRAKEKERSRVAPSAK